MLDGVLSASGNLIAVVTITNNEDNCAIHISNPTDKTDVTINYGKKDNKYTFDGSLRK